MGWRKRAEGFYSRMTPMRCRVAALGGLVIWVLFLRYADPGPLLIAFTMPFGILLICMGPLEFIPEHWFRINFIVSAMMSLFFQGSLMFLGVALSFELPVSKGARLVFILLFWTLQAILYSWAQRRRGRLRRQAANG